MHADASAPLLAELPGTGLIAVRGADAAAFLQAQLTSDIAALGVGQTQYSGYCSPQGRLLATFLVWRCEGEFLLQLPDELRAGMQVRLAKYVLRARVELAPAPLRLFGLWGRGAETALRALTGAVPERDHDAACATDAHVARLGSERYLLAASADTAAGARAHLAAMPSRAPEAAWAALDVAAGVPVITTHTQERYVPQMVNLDLIGGVSYTKGCYPGQEIVARTHYLGRLKQRMYRARVPAAGVQPGDPLYSDAFGPGQASGAVLNVAPPADGGHDVLAVMQTNGAANTRWKSPDGPAVELKELPYRVPQEA